MTPLMGRIPVMPESAHGTYAGYNSWGCRCESCSAAMRVKHRQQREKQLGISKRPRKQAPEAQP